MQNFMKKEAKWQTLWNKIIRYERKKEGYKHAYYELKQTSADYFSYKGFESHQLNSLKALEQSGMVWKFSDQDQRQKPCDSVSIPPMPTYVVIKFPLAFVCIRINDFIKEMEYTKAKSIYYGRACEIAEKIIHTK